MKQIDKKNIKKNKKKFQNDKTPAHPSNLNGNQLRFFCSGTVLLMSAYKTRSLKAFDTVHVLDTFLRDNYPKLPIVNTP